MGVNWSEADLKARGLNKDGKRIVIYEGDVKLPKNAIIVSEPKIKELSSNQLNEALELPQVSFGIKSVTITPVPSITSENANEVDRSKVLVSEKTQLGKWTIFGNVPSSKNNNDIGRMGNGKSILMPSKRTAKYKAETKSQYQDIAMEFMQLADSLEHPLKIGFFFYRKFKHRFDFINACQVVQDMMVQNGCIEDDNCNIMLPYPVGLGYAYDKTNPRVEIYLMK